MITNFGRIEIKLADLLDERDISKNKLCQWAELSWKQLDSYCKNTVTRLDILVLCKLCTVLECKIEDLLEFIPDDEQKIENRR